MTPSGSFQGSKRETCVSMRPLDVDPELVDDVRRVLGRKRHVLRRQRIDRRRPDVAGRQALRLRHVLAHVEDRRVVAPDRRAAGSRTPLGSGSRSRCARARSSAPSTRRSSRSSRPAAGRGRRRSRSRPRTPARSAPGSGGRSRAAPRSSPCGFPWSALWIVFVTLKNSSAPRMIRHSTSSPASCISGMSV